jgi:hypothetical protein
MLATSVSTSPAALLVYEGFNGYPSITVGTTPNSNTFGLNQSIAYAGTTPEALSIQSGLTLSNLQVSGSSAGFSGGTIVAGAQLTIASPYVGTLWGSYLINLSTMGGALGNGAEVRLSDNDSTGGVRFRAEADSRNGVTLSNTLSMGYDSTMVDATTSLATGTTYIILSRMTNVGVALSAGTTGVGTLFALTAAQFNAMKAAPDAEAFLDTAAIGTGNSQITARIADTAVTTGTFSFAAGNRMQFVQVADAGQVDEIRYGATLLDVTPVPEPGIGALLVAGLAGLTGRRRRRG